MADKSILEMDSGNNPTMDELAAEAQQKILGFRSARTSLWDRMDQDYEFWKMAAYELDKWSENITFNEPRLFVDSVCQTLDAAKLHITFFREDKDEAAAALMEQFAFSCFYEVDDLLTKQQLPLLKSLLNFYAAIRGQVAGRILMYKDEDNLLPEIIPYDPRWVSSGSDRRGLAWSGYDTWRDIYSVKEEYPDSDLDILKDNKGNFYRTVAVTDFWDRKYNLVMINNSVKASSGVLASDGEHKLGAPPVIIIPVGSSPIIMANDNTDENISHFGESVLSGGRKLYNTLNKLLTIWMSVAVESRDPSGFIFTGDGSQKINSPYGKGAWTTLPETARAEPLKPPDIANTFPMLWDIISQAVQRSDFVWIKYGQLWRGQELSKVAIAELKEGANRVMVPLLIALGRFYKGAIEKFIDQYKLNGGGKMISGRDSKGNFFQAEITPELFEGKYKIECELISVTPEEDVDNYSKATLAKQSGLASNQFIREKMVKFDDPDRIQREMRDESAEEVSPKLKLLRASKQLTDDGKQQEADMLKHDLTLQLTREAAEMAQLQQVINPPPPPPPEPTGPMEPPGPPGMPPAPAGPPAPMMPPGPMPGQGV